jgi:hypothetical protein
VNKVRLGPIFMVAVPLIAAVIMGMVCMAQMTRRNNDQAQETQATMQVNSLQNLLNQASATPLIDKAIALDNTPDEQAAFLTFLRVNAQASQVKLTQYQNMGPVMARPAPGSSEPAPQPSDYTPVASTLTVQGPYPGVRAFAYSLLRANRLMNMNGVTWKRDLGTDTTTLSFTLIRYVTTPRMQVVTTTVAPAPAGPSGGATR